MQELIASIDQQTQLILLIVVITVSFVAWLIGRIGYQNLRNVKVRELDSVNFQNELLQTNQQRLQEKLAELEQLLYKKEQLLIARGEELVGLRSDLAHQKQHADEKILLLQDAKKQLSQEFENLANRIFDDKSDRFSKSSQSSLAVAINPLREQLKEFKQKVEDVYDKDSKERLSLAMQINQLKQLNLQMSDDANNLAKALKGDNKVQGNWGEVILERVLEESGLHKGREYDTQVSLQSSDGRRRNPDIIIRLPENKDIIVDAKVSLVHYERFCNLDDEGARKTAIKEHVASVRGHINGLSIKDYENLDGIRTLDFVFIFIPVEAAFMAAFEHDPSMFRDAYEKNIIVVGPTTLLATLRTIQSIWRYERQNKNAEAIARQAGAMHDKFVRFIVDLEDVGSHLEKAGKAQQDALRKLSTGSGNLVSSTQKLEKLGAKVKKQLPADIQEMSKEPDLHLIDDVNSVETSEC